jgi:hypothetical protein
VLERAIPAAEERTRLEVTRILKNRFDLEMSRLQTDFDRRLIQVAAETEARNSGGKSQKRGNRTRHGSSSYGFSGDGGPATDARLASPLGLAVDSVGNLYISDTGNNRIREVTTNGSIATIAGTGNAEQTAVFLDQQPFRGTATAPTFTFNSSVPVGAVALRS